LPFHPEEGTSVFNPIGKEFLAPSIVTVVIGSFAGSTYQEIERSVGVPQQESTGKGQTATAGHDRTGRTHSS
jgi:hypothetical protein